MGVHLRYVSKLPNYKGQEIVSRDVEKEKVAINLCYDMEYKKGYVCSVVQVSTKQTEAWLDESLKEMLTNWGNM